MAGSSTDYNFNFSSHPNTDRTVVLVGRTGNGKSATGNTILGRKAFVSSPGLSGTKSISELQSTVLDNGKVIHVIDTPGIFDASVGPEFIGREVVNCLDIAKDGIHAIVVVLSVRRQFSKEEEAVLHSLTYFCPNITDYMIVVVTGGDELEDNDENFEDYLHGKFSKPLQNILKACKNRCVLFDNKTKDIVKKEEQLGQLFVLVDAAIEESGGLPYTSGLVEELKNKAVELRKQQEEVDGFEERYTKEEIFDLKLQMHKSYEEQLRKITERVQSKIRDASKRLERQLEDEQLMHNLTRENIKDNEKEEKLGQLFDAAIEESGGIAYPSGLTEELKKLAVELRQLQQEIEGLEGYTKEEISEMKLEMQKSYEEQLQKITEKVESKIRDTTKRQKEPLTEEQLIPYDTKVQSKIRDTTKRREEPLTNEQSITHNTLLVLENIRAQLLQEKLAGEKDLRLKVESSIQAAQQRSEEEINKLKRDLETAEEESWRIERQTGNPFVKLFHILIEIKNISEAIFG